MSHSEAPQERFYRRIVRGLMVAMLMFSCAVFTPSTAWAQKKKKEEVAPTKSYVLPYMLVMMMLTVGLMTVCRPGKRLDPAEDKKKVEA